MSERIEPADGGSDLPGALRSWVMVLLTLIFVLLYAAVLTGWLRPLADEKMLARLEPVIFVIIGYYFGRLPAQVNEQTLKGEIDRHSKRADAAQSAKEQAQRTTEALEEKVKNARAALTASATYAEKPGDASVNAALHILNS